MCQGTVIFFFSVWLFFMLDGHCVHAQTVRTSNHNIPNLNIKSQHSQNFHFTELPLAVRFRIFSSPELNFQHSIFCIFFKQRGLSPPHSVFANCQFCQLSFFGFLGQPPSLSFFSTPPSHPLMVGPLVQFWLYRIDRRLLAWQIWPPTYQDLN